MRYWGAFRMAFVLGLSVLVLFRAQAEEPFAIAPDTPDESIRGEIQAWGWNIAAASLNKLVPGFNRRFPNVQVNISMSGMNMESRLLLSLSAGVGAPDISQLQARETPRYIATGKLADLTEVAKPYEKAFASSFWDSCVYEGRIRAIPWDMGPCAVYYKRNLLQQYGIDPERIETWDDYIAAGKDLLARSGGKTRMLFLPSGQLYDIFEILVQQNNAQMFDAEGRVCINSPETVRVLTVLRNLLTSGIGARVDLLDHAYLASFKSDTVATYPAAVWFGGIIRDHAPETSGNWGVFRLPAIEPGGLRTSNLGGSSLVIPDQCAHKAAAWKFIEYTLCTPASQIAQFRDFDLFPALLSTHQDPFFDEPVPFFRGQKVRRIFTLDIEKLQPLNRTEDWQEAIRYLTQALSSWAASGNLEAPEPLLDRLEAKMSRRLGRAIAPTSLSLTRGK